MYDLYLDNKKVNPKKEIELNENSTLYLIEKNIVLSKFWWLWFIFDFILCILGGGMSLDDEHRDKQNIIPIKLKGKISDKIDITVTENASPRSKKKSKSIQENCNIRYIDNIVYHCYYCFRGD